jgi:hypothetical protein
MSLKFKMSVLCKQEEEEEEEGEGEKGPTCTLGDNCQDAQQGLSYVHTIRVN